MHTPGRRVWVGVAGEAGGEQGDVDDDDNNNNGDDDDAEEMNAARSFVSFSSEKETKEPRPPPLLYL